MEVEARIARIAEEIYLPTYLGSRGRYLPSLSACIMLLFQYWYAPYYLVYQVALNNDQGTYRRLSLSGVDVLPSNAQKIYMYR